MLKCILTYLQGNFTLLLNYYNVLVFNILYGFWCMVHGAGYVWTTLHHTATFMITNNNNEIGKMTNVTTIIYALSLAYAAHRNTRNNTNNAVQLQTCSSHRCQRIDRLIFILFFVFFFFFFCAPVARSIWFINIGNQICILHICHKSLNGNIITLSHSLQIQCILVIYVRRLQKTSVIETFMHH